MTCNDKGPVPNTSTDSKGKIKGEVNYFENLEGITKSLIRGQQNFIFHFKNKPSTEFYCDIRDEIIDVM